MFIVSHRSRAVKGVGLKIQCVSFVGSNPTDGTHNFLIFLSIIKKLLDNFIIFLFVKK